MISLQQVTLQRGRKVLLQEASLTIYATQKVGIVGSNGSGKTSLFALLQGELSPEHGEAFMPTSGGIAHIQQETPNTKASALEYALQGDTEFSLLQQQLQDAESAEDGMRIAHVHHRLAEIDGYAIPSKAARVLSGLGFSQSELQQPVHTFSGGWRMRLNLAQVLMARAAVLLLDEPTNHLDLEAIVWLETWLFASTQTLLLISHDREFLDKVTTHIVHFHDKTLKCYTGNYSAFEKARAEQLAQQQATHEKQQRARAHLQKFVDRFRYKATKAKQAQSRMKMLEKMELVSAVHQSSDFHFSFKSALRADNPMIHCHQASIAYEVTPILKNIDCSVSYGDRIGLIGPNGAGKSTFVKWLAGQLPTIAGECQYSKKVKIGYFAQHQLEQLKSEQSPLAHLQDLDPAISDQVARRYLGGFHFHHDDVFRSVGSFSGGEKARLVLALIIWQAPNILLLDEPTNHLDIEMREALMLALQEYEGALILISHDRYLIKNVTDDLWLVAGGTMKAFDGDLDDYQQWLTDTSKKQTPQKTKVKQGEGGKAIAAQIITLQKSLDQWQKTLEKLDEKLADHRLYEPQHKIVLQKLILERAQAQSKLTTLEADWRQLNLVE